MVDVTVAGSRRRVEVFTLAMTVGFRGVAVREGALIWGEAGVGEFSPFREYDDEEASSWLRAALEAADSPFPPRRRSRVPVNCTVPAVDAAHAARIVSSSHGCRTAKVKVAEPGQRLDDDRARVAAVRQTIGRSGRIRLDANGGWDVDEAVGAIRDLSVFGIEYVEQPVRTVEELAEVRGRVDVPIAADESIRRAEDPYRVKQLGAADIAVLKVQPLGGVRACLRLASELDMPVVVSSAIESSVGLAAGLALAAALPRLRFACGLATGALLTADLSERALTVRDGFLPAGRVDPSESALASARADDVTTTRWLDRLARCDRLLQERGR